MIHDPPSPEQRPRRETLAQPAPGLRGSGLRGPLVREHIPRENIEPHSGKDAGDQGKEGWIIKSQHRAGGGFTVTTIEKHLHRMVRRETGQGAKMAVYRLGGEAEEIALGKARHMLADELPVYSRAGSLDLVNGGFHALCSRWFGDVIAGICCRHTILPAHTSPGKWQALRARRPNLAKLRRLMLSRTKPLSSAERPSSRLQAAHTARRLLASIPETTEGAHNEPLLSVGGGGRGQQASGPRCQSTGRTPTGGAGGRQPGPRSSSCTRSRSRSRPG